MSQIEAAPQTAADLADFAGVRHGGRRAVLVKRDGSWRERSYAEVAGEIKRLGAGFVQCGIQAGDRVCILADTRPEWSVASYALWSAGAVVVPIYPSNSPGECEWVAGNSGAVAVLVENLAQLAKIEAVREALPALRTIFIMDGQDAPEGVLALEDVAALDGDAEELSHRCETVSPDDLALIIYTSGTTGPPKGCMLSHRGAVRARSAGHAAGLRRVPSVPRLARVRCCGCAGRVSRRRRTYCPGAR